MIDLIKLALSGFWKFTGFIIILYYILHYVCNLIFKIIHLFFRSRIIKKQGYPPPHCNADGDLKKLEHEEYIK